MEITIVDTFNFFFRNFYGLPPLRSRKGFPTGMIQGVVNFIRKLPSYSSEYIVFTLDSDSEKGFRRQLYQKYKANRPPLPPDLKKQIPVAIELLKKMGFNLLKRDGFESDDLIASLVQIALRDRLQVQIVSTDKDLCQLIVDQQVVLFDPFKGIKLDEKGCIKKYGVAPSQFVEFQGLVGDPSDNIPGVRGIGPKRARELIGKYQNLEGIYANLSQLPMGIRKKLEKEREMAFLSRQLVTLKGNLFQEIEWEKFKYPSNPFLKVRQELEELDIREVFRKIKIEITSPKFQFQIRKIDPLEGQKLLKEIERAVVEEWENGIGFGEITSGEESKKKGKKIGQLEQNREKMTFYYLPNPSILFLKELIGKGIIGYRLKKLEKGIFKHIIPFQPVNDIALLGWILNPDGGGALSSLGKRYLNYPIPDKISNLKELGERLAGIKLLYPIFEAKLWERAKKEMEEVELPLIPILSQMEEIGIKIDSNYLFRLEKEIEKKLIGLKEEIYQMANERINLNSPKQLQQLLFQRLKLPPKRKTKTGYSTDETVLTALAKLHPIPGKILEYRRLVKLDNTYIRPLIQYSLLSSDRRVRTTFIQTGTATGRLASKNPNLQNIPTDRQINIRKGFYSSNLLLSFDYSQIELRLLAHYSGDPSLIATFFKDGDIHLETARKLFPMEPEQFRGVAKSINFGLIYGMGAKKLAETVGVSLSEAKKFIERYFQNFPKIRDFIENLKEVAREQGYLETLLGRRRFFNFSQGSGRTLAKLEREAVNSLFQGGAADIIKKAMVEGWEQFPPALIKNDKQIGKVRTVTQWQQMVKRIRKYFFHPSSFPFSFYYSPLLQIHDELLLETPSCLEVIWYKWVMEQVVDLTVPLKVEVKIGKRWGEMMKLPEQFLNLVKKMAESKIFPHRRTLILNQLGRGKVRQNWNRWRWARKKGNLWIIGKSSNSQLGQFFSPIAFFTYRVSNPPFYRKKFSRFKSISNRNLSDIYRFIATIDKPPIGLETLFQCKRGFYPFPTPFSNPSLSIKFYRSLSLFLKKKGIKLLITPGCWKKMDRVSMGRFKKKGKGISRKTILKFNQKIEKRFKRKPKKAKLNKPTIREINGAIGKFSSLKDKFPTTLGLDLAPTLWVKIPRTKPFSIPTTLLPLL